MRLLKIYGHRFFIRIVQIEISASQEINKETQDQNIEFQFETTFENF